MSGSEKVIVQYQAEAKEIMFKQSEVSAVEMIDLNEHERKMLELREQTEKLYEIIKKRNADVIDNFLQEQESVVQKDKNSSK